MVQIGFPRTVILLETDEDLMKQRLQERGETSRRADDLSEAIESRLTWFHNCIAEIAHYYGPHNKLYTVRTLTNHNFSFAKRMVQRINAPLFRLANLERVPS